MEQVDENPRIHRKVWEINCLKPYLISLKYIYKPKESQ